MRRVAGDVEMKGETDLEFEAAMQVAEGVALSEREALTIPSALWRAGSESEAFIRGVTRHAAFKTAQLIVAKRARFYTRLLKSESSAKVVKRAQADAIAIVRHSWPPLRGVYSELTGADLVWLANDLNDRVKSAAKTKQKGYRLRGG